MTKKSFLSRLLYSNRSPLQPFVVKAVRRFEHGSFRQRLELGALERPHYGYCVYHAADLAKKLNYDSISVIEFGVAGGNGLVILEQYAQEVAAEIGIKIEVYGFDNVTGLPAPTDYRDLPYHWKAGFFEMDEAALRRRIRHAKLVLGDVADTLKTFFETYKPAPIGAVLYDLDYYSSTKPALEILRAEEQHRLPRLYCYFDDIIGAETELYNDYSGVRLAMSEFNAAGEMKLSPCYHLTTSEFPKIWYHQIYSLHDFQHGRYNDFVSQDNAHQLPLSPNPDQ